MQAPNTTCFLHPPSLSLYNLPSSLLSHSFGKQKVIYSSTYLGAYTTLKTDFLALKLSDTVRLFRAEVRPAPSHCLSAGACDKGQHRSCWKPHCSFWISLLKFSASRPPKSLKQDCWGAETMRATCGNTPTHSRLRWSTLTNSNFQRSFTTA